MSSRMFAFVAALLLVGACEQKQPQDTARPTNALTHSPGDARRRLSPDLLKILADPGDKGPLTYTVDANGDEWLVNLRNGFRYPVDDGVPVMLLDEGAKHRDPSVINNSKPSEE